ncbi:peptide deformylase [Bacillaceae bacterium Marseille-Q3522]|nr:peptide deformylase [Bacillaceae bacterium Marseille-Q3522]
MAIRKIVHFPAEILETKCKPVTKFNKQLGHLLDDMYETMIEFDGVGLAAPQININRQIAVVETDDESGIIELINPQIFELKGEQLDAEGCLSFPGIYGEVPRADFVKVQAQNRKGELYLLEAEGYLARVLQHEIDHLNGILFTSKVTRYIEEEALEGEIEA